MKVKLKDPNLFKSIKSFLTSYLPVVKKKSPHTISAYQYALNLYFQFLAENYHLELKDIRISDFNQEKIVGFLEWLKAVRKNEVTTINQRLFHIRGFCKYLMKNDVLSFILYEEIRDISEAKDARVMDFIWLSVEEVKLILEQPDINKKTGIRADLRTVNWAKYESNT